MCLYPTLRKNKKYVANKKNGGRIPPLPFRKMEDGRMVEDQRVMYVPTGCGNCMECRKQKARGWQVRLMEECRSDKRGIFITLTFSNESIKELGEAVNANRKNKIEGYERDNAIAKLGMRRFLERWRKKYKKSVKHWLITELGHEGTENIHMHGIIWTGEPREEITRIWNYGFTWMERSAKAFVNEQTVNYCVKYVYKQDLDHKEYKGIVLTTAGIGKNYLNRIDSRDNKYRGTETRESYRTRTGHEIALPIYYRNKIYTEEERTLLWQQKLDEEVRYVDGMEIDVSKSDEEYYKTLWDARAKNKRLGYGDNEINWNRRNYENEQRNMKYMERIKGK